MKCASRVSMHARDCLVADWPRAADAPEVCWLQIGEITSGAFSPCLKKNIAMGYVEKPFAKSGTQLKVRAAAGRPWVISS